jgi:hypothetical protein
VRKKSYLYAAAPLNHAFQSTISHNPIHEAHIYLLQSLTAMRCFVFMLRKREVETCVRFASAFPKSGCLLMIVFLLFRAVEEREKTDILLCSSFFEKRTALMAVSHRRFWK